ncbi:hypothetical protein ACFQ7J_07275 [Streptomyces sp. NPDC056501]|uniref:hypothetical protein n=1 Tax=Streptomyces sp. NPDC056501 TaxID=3345841 RepID=UPI0036AA9EBB
MHARFASAAGLAAALAGLGDGLLQHGHQVDDDRAGRRLALGSPGARPLPR